eukprot:XP_001705993.1 Hypothetical protein GL50803_35976 [Giardia lamblia ATCC 50803]
MVELFFFPQVRRKNGVGAFQGVVNGPHRVHQRS